MNLFFCLLLYIALLLLCFNDKNLLFYLAIYFGVKYMRLMFFIFAVFIVYSLFHIVISLNK